MNSDSNNRIHSFDIMRIICMLGVIVIHVVGHRIDDTSDTVLWHTANILESFARFSVPVFMMITGALLIGSESSLSPKLVFFKRILRVLVPSALWACIYTLLVCTDKFTAPFSLEKLKVILSDIWATPVYQHLWYVYALIAFYIVLPVLALFVKHCSLKTVGYALLIWLAASSILPTLASVFPFLKITADADLNVRSGYIGFFLLGYFLNNVSQNIKLKYWAALYVFASLLTAALSFAYLQIKGASLRPFYEYFSPNVILSSVAAFFLLKGVFERFSHISGSNIISLLSSCTFGVYLSHELIRTLLYGALKDINPFAEIALSVIFTAVISFAFTALIIKTPLSFALTGQKKSRSQ